MVVLKTIIQSHLFTDFSSPRRRFMKYNICVITCMINLTHKGEDRMYCNPVCLSVCLWAEPKELYIIWVIFSQKLHGSTSGPVLLKVDPDADPDQVLHLVTAQKTICKSQGSCVAGPLSANQIKRDR